MDNVGQKHSRATVHFIVILLYFIFSITVVALLVDSTMRSCGRYKLKRSYQSVKGRPYSS